MKLMHLSDLHIGKRLMDVSLLEDQRFIFDQILSVMDREQPDAVLIAGDIYDRSAPSADAMELLNELLEKLADRKKPVLMISGNHDSSERLSFASSFLEKSRIHISPVYNGHISPIAFSDEYGEVKVWLMPYVQPENVARFFPGKAIRNANDAAETVIGEMKPDPSERNVIVSHQFITGGTTSDSERRNIGTLEDVDASLYDSFDYVALGHLHRPQSLYRKDGTMRYPGTPLMYSRSEMGAEKSVTIADLRDKGNIEIRTVPLKPLHELRLARGRFDDLMKEGPSEGNASDFFFVELTDEDDIPNAASRLRERFPNMLAMSYDNHRTRSFTAVDAPDNVEEKQPMELIQELYQLVHPEGRMSGEAIDFVQETLKKMGGLHP